MREGDFATNREKLDKIGEVVGELFREPQSVKTFEALMLIDSICDVPLFGAEDEDSEWDK